MRQAREDNASQFVPEPSNSELEGGGNTWRGERERGYDLGVSKFFPPACAYNMAATGIFSWGCFTLRTFPLFTRVCTWVWPLKGHHEAGERSFLSLAGKITHVMGFEGRREEKSVLSFFATFAKRSCGAV